MVDGATLLLSPPLMMDAIFKCRRFTSTEAVGRHLTLRNACEEYRAMGGRCWSDAEPAELSCSRDQEYVLSLVKFDNIIGHVDSEEAWLMGLRNFNSIYDMLMHVAARLEDTIETGSLWTPKGCELYKRSQGGRWFTPLATCSEEDSAMLDRVRLLRWLPVSCSTVHASLEASTDPESSYLAERCYAFPRDSVPSTGLYGTLHNNQVIDMSPYEMKNEPDQERRAFKDDYLGFICAGHTSHSYDAGRVRRVTCDVKVRILSHNTVNQLMSLADRSGPFPGDRDWVVFIMGFYSEVTYSTIVNFCVYHRLCCNAGISNFSLYIDLASKTCVISVSSGTMIKMCSNGVWADSVELHRSDRTPRSAIPTLDISGKDMLRACMSGYFNLHPYIASDRPPRPTISSAQTPQAVCLPFCPATAAVSPCHVFKPLVTTPLYETIMKELEQSSSVADYLPGENIMVLYLNDEETYEDSIYVSSRYIDNGGFSTVSICKYNLPYGDYIPEPGTRLCSRVVQWWKNPCQKDCGHTREWMEKTRVGERTYTLGRSPSGVVISKTSTISGDWVVKVRSFQQLQTGDKVSTGHGQKGVVTIKEHFDMPVAQTSSGEMVIPDMVVAMSSIICRQTNGQLYETHKATEAVRECTLPVVQAEDKADISDEVFVFSGTTGDQYMTAFGSNGELRPTRASLGFVRVHNQTQMTRERHFTSHRRMYAGTLRTPVRRAPGGGVAFGEMEIQAAVSAGLTNCVSEIVRRGDQVVVKVCTVCQRLRLLCACTSDTVCADVTLPYDTVVVDCVSAIVYNGSNVYTIEIEH